MTRTPVLWTLASIMIVTTPPSAMMEISVQRTAAIRPMEHVQIQSSKFAMMVNSVPITYVLKMEYVPTLLNHAMMEIPAQSILAMKLVTNVFTFHWIVMMD